MTDDDRPTARMPVVTLTDLLFAQLEPVEPDPDTFDPPTNPRGRLFAKGTEQSLKRIDPDEAWVHPSRLPTEPMMAVEPLEFDALDEWEIAAILAPLSRS